MRAVRVLVIHESEESMQRIRPLLQAMGYEVISSASSAAVSTFVQRQPKFAVIAPCVPEPVRRQLVGELASLRPRLGVLMLNQPDSLQRLVQHAKRWKPTVLAVEDHEEARYVVTHHLRGAGFQVLEASTGADALKQAHRAHAIVLDIHLPDLLGFEICKRLKADPSTAHIPVIFLTATARDNVSVQRGRELGAAAYLVSPVEPATLIRAVKDALA